MNTLTTVLPYLIGAAMVATFLVLAAGVIAMSQGGRFNARYGNKLMRWRILLQGLAIALLGGLYLLTQQ